MSENRELLLFWPIATLIWIGTLIGVVVIAFHAAIRDFGWNK
jgi:hypothetical protein